MKGIDKQCIPPRRSSGAAWMYVTNQLAPRNKRREVQGKRLNNKAGHPEHSLQKRKGRQEPSSQRETSFVYLLGQKACFRFVFLIFPVRDVFLRPREPLRFCLSPVPVAPPPTCPPPPLLVFFFIFLSSESPGPAFSLSQTLDAVNNRVRYRTEPEG